MKAAARVLIAGLLAAVAACARRQEAPKAYDAKSTYEYLQDVGRVRAQSNADNKERIPAMIRNRDLVMLGTQSARTEDYKRALAALPTAGVDPDALLFAKNFEAILDSYRSVCMDAAELFRELQAANARPSAPAVVLPPVRFGTEAYQTDTIGTVDSLLESLDRLDTGARTGTVALQPIIGKLRVDRDSLRAAKVAHHDFSVKLKATLAQRYPGRDWNAKEILP